MLAAMTARFAGTLLAALGCLAGASSGGCSSDANTLGARGSCAYGGVLTDCPDAARTAEAACWRLVDCGAIPVAYESPDNPGDRRFDWGACVDFLEGQTADRRRVMIQCVAASICDELRAPGSPESPNPAEVRCLRLGDP
jgi:hypothetical protein